MDAEILSMECVEFISMKTGVLIFLFFQLCVHSRVSVATSASMPPQQIFTFELITVTQDVHHHSQPENPQSAHAKAGDQHGLEGLPCPSDSAGENLNEHIGKIAGGQHPEKPLADLDYRLVPGEELKQGSHEDQQQDTQG